MLSLKKSGFRTCFVFAILLGAGLLSDGCCSTCPKYVGPNEPVNVLVTWKEKAKELFVFPESVRLCEQKQFARWILYSGSENVKLKITFPAGTSPFASGEKAVASLTGTVVPSGVPRPGTAGKRYKYVVEILDDKGTVLQSIDPWVEVDR